jgi:IS1 family transposase
VEPLHFKNYEHGDCWGYVALKRMSFFHITHHVGKRTDESADDFVGKLKNRIEMPTHENKLKIFSDGNLQYNTALLKHYKKDVINYGQLIKIKEAGILVDKIKRKIYGNPNYKDIETTCIESYNSVLRNSCSRLVRKTKSFSKKVKLLDLSLEFVQAHNNFIKLYGRETPAMKEGLMNRKLCWNDIFYAKLTFIN